MKEKTTVQNLNTTDLENSIASSVEIRVVASVGESLEACFLTKGVGALEFEAPELAEKLFHHDDDKPTSEASPYTTVS